MWGFDLCLVNKKDRKYNKKPRGFRGAFYLSSEGVEPFVRQPADMNPAFYFIRFLIKAHPLAVLSSLSRRIASDFSKNSSVYTIRQGLNFMA